MNVLVTGGAGFIGSHIVDQLIGAGHKLSIVDSLVSGRRELAHREASLRVMDIRDPQLDAFVESIHPEVVVHAAAQVSVSRSVADPMADASVNVLAGPTRRLHLDGRRCLRRHRRHSDAGDTSRACRVAVRDLKSDGRAVRRAVA